MTRRNITRDTSFEVNGDASTDSDGRTMEGYAALFNEPTEINSAFEGNFTERIAPGAFSKTLDGGRKPKCQWQHGKDTRVGSTPIGVYDEIREDGKGLYVRGTLFDNPVVEPVRQAIQSGAVDGMSFTFQVVRDEWNDGDGNPVTGRDLQRKLFDGKSDLHRNIREVKLLEAGPVLFPAYAGTSVGVRSADDVSPEDKEEIIAGYCRSAGITDLDKQDVDPAKNNDSTVEDPDEDDEETKRAKGQIADEDDDAEGGIDSETEAPKKKSSYTSEMKADGTPTEERADGDPKKPYGDVTYADPGYQKDGKKRYPVDTEKHVKAALSYINQGDNADAYTHDQLAKIKAKISSAAKKMGIEMSESKSSDTDAIVRDTSAAGSKEDSAAHRTLSEDTQPITTKKVKIMTLAELRERLAVILVRQEELSTTYREIEMPDAEDTEFETLKSERSATEAKIAKIEARLAEFKTSATSGTKHTERGTDGGPTYIKKTDEAIYDIETLRRDSYNDEDLRDRLRDNAMRAVDVAKFGGGRAVNREDAQAQIEHFLNDKDDAQGSLAKRMLVSGSALYERAWSKAVAAGGTAMLNHEEQRAMELSVAANGAYAVPFQLDPTIIWTSAGVINPLRQIARVEQIVGRQWQGVVSTGTSVTRSAEISEVADGTFTLTQPVVDTQRVAGFVPFSYEIAEAWGQVRSEITAALVDAKGREEATSFITGNGTPPAANGLLGTLSGQPNVTSSGGSTFSASNVYALETALDPRWRANGTFLAHKYVYNLVRQFDTAGGAQLWERIGAGLPNQLLGYPNYESSISTTGGFVGAGPLTTGGILAVFGDFSQFLIVDRIGMNVELIPQIFGGSGRPTGQRGIYATWMNNSKVLTPLAFATLTVS